MKLDRRNFLKTTVLSSAGISVSSILPSVALAAKNSAENKTDFVRTIAMGRENDNMTHEIGFHRTQVLFEAGTYGYHIYRIPSIVATQKGTLLSFCAARKGRGGDWDPIDIVTRRSTDSGQTWDTTKTLVHLGNHSCDNPVPITDFITGDVHLIYQIDYARCYYIKSNDDGITWSEPVEITETINNYKKIYPWEVLAPGPGHGIQLNNGRLVVPFWLSPDKSHRPSVVVSAYSDDHGRSWKAGDVAVPDNDVNVIPNETSCVQLADGRVLFNSRNESINYRRLFTYSEDGAANWSTPVFADAFFEPICFGSMCRYSLQPYQSKNRILFCNPDSRHNPWVSQPNTPRSARNRRRANLTIRMTYDEGHTWPVSKVIDSNIAGYSDIAVTPDGMIHVLYEGGIIPGSESHGQIAHLSVVTFDLQWLTNGKDKLCRNDKSINIFDHTRVGYI